MAFQHWDAFFVPQLPEIAGIAEISEIPEIPEMPEIIEIPEIAERRLTQKTLKYFNKKFEKKSGPTHVCVPVDEHVHVDNTIVPSHMRKVKTKKESKTNNSNKRTGKAKHGAFPILPDNYKNKRDAQEAFSCHLDMMLELSRGSKK